MYDLADPEKRQLKWYDYIIAAWPLIMILFGGAIGGAFGALAAALNVKILQSDLPVLVRYVLTPFIGLTAVGLYFAVAIGLVYVFPDLFGAK